MDATHGRSFVWDKFFEQLPSETKTHFELQCPKRCVMFRAEYERMKGYNSETTPDTLCKALKADFLEGFEVNSEDALSVNVLRRSSAWTTPNQRSKIWNNYFVNLTDEQNAELKSRRLDFMKEYYKSNGSDLAADLDELFLNSTGWNAIIQQLPESPDDYRRRRRLPEIPSLGSQAHSPLTLASDQDSFPTCFCLAAVLVIVFLVCWLLRCRTARIPKRKIRLSEIDLELGLPREDLLRVD